VHTPIPKPAAPNGNASQPGWCFWIDRGGTFTDIVAVSPAGHWHTDKLLSVNPEQYVDAASEGVNRLLQRHGSAGDAVTEIRLGTTVATNALLEHAGAKVALVVTAGFADLPVIRQQDRPQLFHRELRRPAPLFACVIEATERVTHDGSVLVPLDTTASHSLQTALVAARKEGCEAVAICFLHGWAHPGHELLAAAAARAAGFTQVFSSHQVSPLPRWVPRADTTLADAYLTPVLQRYIQGFGERVAALAPPKWRSCKAMAASRMQRGFAAWTLCCRARPAAWSACKGSAVLPVTSDSSVSTWAAPVPMWRSLMATCRDVR
jgi:5-oxoprolinase (ATP-hydrolysing)